ncbi:MAG: DUF3276 family protein [Treponema sp.]|jgi:hypothetical protein|nr:DUF3276 family protein [Treponema sp.]
MGVRGEVFSTKVALQNRTYFFNVKENRLGDLYLNIVESKNKDEGGFERQSVILFADDLQQFLRGFDESLRVLEKAVREKRRGSQGKEERKTVDKPSPRHRSESRYPVPDSSNRKSGRWSGSKAENPHKPPGRSRPDRKGKKENYSHAGFSGQHQGSGPYTGSSGPQKKKIVVKKRHK